MHIPLESIVEFPGQMHNPLSSTASGWEAWEKQVVQVEFVESVHVLQLE